MDSSQAARLARQSQWSSDMARYPSIRDRLEQAAWRDHPRFAQQHAGQRRPRRHAALDDTGFGVPDNAISLISKDSVIDLPKQNKLSLARALTSHIAEKFNQN